MSNADSLTDPMTLVPDPETVRAMLTASVRRTGVLRGLLRLSERNAVLAQEDEQIALGAVAPTEANLSALVVHLVHARRAGDPATVAAVQQQLAAAGVRLTFASDLPASGPDGVPSSPARS